jgi:preprotein translocase subunit SecA
MLKNFVRIFGGNPNKRELDKYTGVVDQINELEKPYEALSDEALQAKTTEFRARLAEGETLDDILVEAFAVVREASKRTIGLRHYDVQLLGGAILHQGRIAEMRTGEGKTLVATLPIYLNALVGKGAHLITVNDYLARRDARWMAPIYNMLGLSIGVLQMAARTENGKKAFIIDLEKESPHEDQHQLRMTPRQEAYAADITYGTNSEFGFDYLRDNMVWRKNEKVQRGHFYAIVDEVDNVLIDEARTPLIISGPAQDEGEWYVRMAQVVRALKGEDYEISERDRNVTLSEIGEAHVEELLNVPLRDPDRPEDVTPEQARLLGYLEQALRAQFLFKRNKDYLVQAGKVVIVDEFTGRLMPGRRWSDGLHQAVEAKEGVRVQAENVTYATITIQNYFRMYDKLAGMTGTAVTEAEEFDKIYKLSVLAIPTNLEFTASRTASNLVETEGKDENGYKFRFYTRTDDPQKTPVYWKRKDFPDIIYRTEEAKLRALTREILKNHVLGRPILVGTTSVELSERVSSRLRAEPLRRLVQILLLRYTWFEANKRSEDGRQIPELQFLVTPLDQLDVAAMRKLGRDLGFSINPEDPKNLPTIKTILEIPNGDDARLENVLKAGIPHQVLNARKHTEESQIIAQAGAFGSLTIATNMAGRGVDIKLGGELSESALAGVNRLLTRAGQDNAYEMSLQERMEALQSINPSEYYIYETEVNEYLQYIQNMERVRQLGGLHVIGSERHEARRIDNQLRGRAARQGDPGSSRFYLSMEDELMRLFGGEQADNLMQRMKIDDDIPLEFGVVSRIVEQSQTRVEGSNFDVRKHLLEYDDVLNTQRAKVYEQRNLIFDKDDLSEDVLEMLRTEVANRVPIALNNEEGPWKLLSWLEHIQPTIIIGRHLFPSFTIQLLTNHIFSQYQQTQGVQTGVSTADTRKIMLDIARESLSAEENHILKTTKSLLDQAQERLNSQLTERLDAVDTFFEGLSLEEEGEARSPRQIQDDLTAVTRFPLRLTNEQTRLLRDDPNQVKNEVRLQVESAVISQAITRLVGSVERRMEESLIVDIGQLAQADWDDLADQLLGAIQSVFDKRRERLVGAPNDPGGQIGHDLGVALDRVQGLLGANDIIGLLMMMPQGSRTTFDKKTHLKQQTQTQRLSYIFYATQFIDQEQPEEISQQVLEHLEKAQATLHRAWGVAEWSRLANTPINEMSALTQRGFATVLGEDILQQIYSMTLNSLDAQHRETLITELGRQALTEVYRQLLLAVITELWVDYLTQMEALRVSIGLEAYAQRDPLVQYKNRAFELFQELLGNMRMGVVTRMFTFRPRDLSTVQTSTARPEAQKIAEQTEAIEESTPSETEIVSEDVDSSLSPIDKEIPQEQSEGKKRRRRHK